MPLSLQLEGQSKAQLAVSLAALLLSDSKVEITADNLNAVLAASTIEVPSYLPVLYAAYLEKSGGVSKFLSGPSASSGGAAPAAAAGGKAAPASGAPAAAAAPEKPKEEEVDALDGGMDMFGGGGGEKSGDY